MGYIDMLHVFCFPLVVELFLWLLSSFGCQVISLVADSLWMSNHFLGLPSDFFGCLVPLDVKSFPLVTEHWRMSSL